jgi:hypothetical protein
MRSRAPVDEPIAEPHRGLLHDLRARVGFHLTETAMSSDEPRRGLPRMILHCLPPWLTVRAKEDTPVKAPSHPWLQGDYRLTASAATSRAPPFKIPLQPTPHALACAVFPQAGTSRSG